MNPRAVPCPACMAPAGEPCTQPTDSSRRSVNWHHLSREAAAEAIDREPAPTDGPMRGERLRAVIVDELR